MSLCEGGEEDGDHVNLTQEEFCELRTVGREPCGYWRDSIL